MDNIWIYDIEVFSHDWIVVAHHLESGEKLVFHNDNYKVAEWIDMRQPVLGGYNSKHYDQWILKAIYHGADNATVKELNDFIFADNDAWNFPFLNRKSHPFINFDLMDDIPVPLRLKEIEGNLGMDIEESSVSFHIDRPLTEAELTESVRYCSYDVDATVRLFAERKDYLNSKIAVGAMCGLSAADSLRLTNAKLTAEFLGAKPPNMNQPDRDFYEFPENLIITKYPQVVEFFADIDPARKRELKTEIAGVPHKLAWGGLHGARECYSAIRSESRKIASIDVVSYYPSLMIVNEYMSRNVPDPAEFKRVYERRLAAKKAGDKATADALKLVLNTTFGAMNNQYNKLYDPRMALAVCVSGQLYLIDLIEKLEDVPSFELIQSNTDGLIVSYDSACEPEIKAVIAAWEQRTGFQMESEEIERIFQKDVNNYVQRSVNGKVKVKGGYVSNYEGGDFKQYSMVIVSKAVVAHLLDGVPLEETINSCDDMEQFQIVCKAGSTYDKVVWKGSAGEVEVQNTNRVFASINKEHGTLYKVKLPKAEGEKERRDKIANLPDHCFIANRAGYKIGMVDKQFYIDLAQKRINDYLGIKPEKKSRRKKDMAPRTTKTTEESTAAATPEAPKGLYAKLLMLQSIMDSFNWSKDGKNRHQSYEYITEKQYKNNFKQARSQAGLLWKMEEIGHEYLGTISDKMHLILTKFRGRLIDPDTGEFEEYLFSGSGADNGDKALYKAYTGGLKYFLASNFLVAEDTDPESDEEEVRQNKPKYTPPERREEIKQAAVNQDGPATEEQLEAIALGITMLEEAQVDAEVIGSFSEMLATELSKADAEQLLDAINELMPAS
ncbi:ERF family protein [Paenibacillus alkalitolerans]|uniref:ERF family protein n=1 Tax=Paenibacillus alkalitolerans TaxID=2799335 RepID=UPI0018F793FF|nr:ERF family protein [Paenibacillus alkalitolerans]